MLDMQNDSARTDLALTLLGLLNILGKFLAVASVVSVLGYTLIAALLDLDASLGCLCGSGSSADSAPLFLAC